MGVYANMTTCWPVYVGAEAGHVQVPCPPQWFLHPNTLKHDGRLTHPAKW